MIPIEMITNPAISPDTSCQETVCALTTSAEFWCQSPASIGGETEVLRVERNACEPRQETETRLNRAPI